jgi:hypothetical protein
MLNALSRGKEKGLSSCYVVLTAKGHSDVIRGFGRGM